MDGGGGVVVVHGRAIGGGMGGHGSMELGRGGGGVEAFGIGRDSGRLELEGEESWPVGEDGRGYFRYTTSLF